MEEPCRVNVILMDPMITNAARLVDSATVSQMSSVEIVPSAKRDIMAFQTARNAIVLPRLSVTHKVAIVSVPSENK